jgi:hypothetical protein
MTPREKRAWDRAWTLGYTQGQYNMRRVILRRIYERADALGACESIVRYLETWPRKRRKVKA